MIVQQNNKICTVLRKYIFILLSIGLLGCKPQYTLTAVPKAGTAVETVVADEKAEAIIAPYRSAVKQQLAQELVFSPFAMEKGLPESALSNVIADAVFSIAQNWCLASDHALPDFCLLNMGGIRTALPQGIIRMEHVYEVMPFENEIVLLKLSLEKYNALLAYVADKGGAPVAGIRLQIKGSQTDNVVWLNGKKPDSTGIWVVTSDFLAQGGDGMTFFAEPMEYIETRVKVRDAIAEYFQGFQKQGKPLRAEKDGRIYK